MKVSDLMKQAYTIKEDISLKDAAKIISSKNLGSLIALSDGKIKGIITERDLVKNFGKKEGVFECMNKKVITIDENEDIDSALEIMRSNKIKRLPVTEKGGLVGVITVTDIAGNVDEFGESFFFD